MVLAAGALTVTAALIAGGLPAHAAPATARAATAGAAATTSTPKATAKPTSASRTGSASRTTSAPRTATTPTTAPTPRPTASPTRAPQPKGRAVAIDVTGSAVLTLPAKDHLRDSTTVRVRSGSKGSVDVLAVAGKKVVHLGDALQLKRVTTGWARSVRVPVGSLAAGRWSIRVRRTDVHTIRARSGDPLVVGSGRPVHVLVHPAARVLYPWRDGVLDSADVTLTATDETGTPIPVRGSVRLDAGRLHLVRALTAAATARIPVVGLPLGAATLTTTVTGPAGKAVRTTALTLAPTGVGTLRLARSADTVQPVVDGLLDVVVLTTSGAAAAASPATVSGTLTISLGTTVVQRFAVPDGTARTFTWDGRTKGVIVPGTYTATLSLRGPEGVLRTRTKTLVVTKDHLPYRVQDLFTVAAGNQQGLAVHDGTFYVGYDDGDGTGRIDLYSSSGALTDSWGPLGIGHAAELSYSTTTGHLYAANGGGTTPTTVWELDPGNRGAILNAFDLSALGPNGMVAVDDANQRLLVFAGTPGAYTITPVSMLPVTTTDASGTTTVPAGTRGTSVPIAVTGMPQGIELVGQRLVLYTSLKQVNHEASYDLTGSPVLSSGADLMNVGEGEGMAVDLPTGTIYVGTHSANRVGRLVPVGDE